MVYEESTQLANSRILVISHGFQTAYERGFCNALAFNGARVILAASDNTDQSHMHDAVDIRNIRGSQDASRPTWLKMINLVRYHARLILLAWKERSSCLHVIGLTGMPILTGIVEGLLFRFTCKRYLLTVHNLLPHDAHTAWNRRVYRWLYRIPHILIAHTQGMRDQLVSDFGISSEKIVVMQHGCELAPAFVPPSRTVVAAGARILFFGGIAKYKGLDLLLDSFFSLPSHFELKIFGVCRSASLGAEIEVRIRDFPDSSRITWRNEYVSEEEMALAMSWADILVLPYRHIDQSGVIFQALKFGVPIVATRVGEFERIVTHQIGELCEPDDAVSLNAAIIRLADRLNSVSREYIAGQAKMYDWSTTVRALKSVYE